MGSINMSQNSVKYEIISRGYVMVRQPDHPRAHGNGYVLKHVLVAEKALGHFLPKEAQVHHFDEDRANNSNGNLVICQDQAYHTLLHTRFTALKCCGNPNHRMCIYCKRHDDPSTMVKASQTSLAHRDCRALYHRNNYHRRIKRQLEKRALLRPTGKYPW
jgi:hypothetical protein